MLVSAPLLPGWQIADPQIARALPIGFRLDDSGTSTFLINHFELFGFAISREQSDRSRGVPDRNCEKRCLFGRSLSRHFGESWTGATRRLAKKTPYETPKSCAL
jgi:hypothetical protein